MSNVYHIAFPSTTTQILAKVWNHTARTTSKSL